LLKSGKLPYNPYFLFPFLLWVVVGGVLLSVFSKEALFFGLNTHYNAVGNTIMYYTTWMGEGFVVVTALLLLMLLPRFRNWWYFSTAVLCNIIPFLLQQWLKAVFNAPRPQLYFKGNMLLHYIPDWPVLLHNSFPSGHSEGAFSFFCFLSLLLPERYRKWGLLFFLLGMAVCYSRLYLAAHFFEDVYLGSIIGATGTTLVYIVMYSFKSKLKSQN
jgi:membrane-associated phospholipid phosphatase